MKKIVRKNKSSIVDVLTEAQKLAFAPIAFCALNSAIELGIIDFLDKSPANTDDIISALNLDNYTVETILEALEINNLVVKKEEKYSLTKISQMFLYDDMTKANFNFIKDVCYIGASELTSSFRDKKPNGLKKLNINHPTIYTALTTLPKKMQKSWYEFDHFYSDNSFEEVFSIISQKYNSIYDIGGNTGKFESLCLKNNKSINITLLDLKENIEKIKNDEKLKNCKFIEINVLDKKPNYPKISNSAILMSQFLDCFSKADIVKILSDLSEAADKNSSIYILEPYTDKQKFLGAKYALIHSSLYFTCMANGVSKFYTFKEMEELINKAGLKISEIYDNIGRFDYTLLKVSKS